MRIFFVLGFIIAYVAIVPFLSIWSLNTLFPALQIPFTLETWAAAVLLAGLFKSNVSVNK